jgi:ABC-type uncharacterized transport system ATPase subunit
MTDNAMIDNQATIPTVDIRELTCRFGDFVAVDRASFTVDRGEIFGLITREIPRLCRGGSKSLTVPAVTPRAPWTRIRTRAAKHIGEPT